MNWKRTSQCVCHFFKRQEFNPEKCQGWMEETRINIDDNHKDQITSQYCNFCLREEINNFTVVSLLNGRCGWWRRGTPNISFFYPGGCSDKKQFIIIFPINYFIIIYPQWDYFCLLSGCYNGSWSIKRLAVLFPGPSSVCLSIQPIILARH